MPGPKLSPPGDELVIDIGNSRMKMGHFRLGQLRAMEAVKAGELAAVVHFLDGAVPVRIAVGSVAAADPGFLKDLGQLAPVVELKGSGPSPLQSVYTSPQTLGVDRLANATGAALLFPGRAVLAIDLGSCATFDAVDELAVYRGGIISPGLRMRARAMHAFSARLPEVDPPSEPVLPGHDTVTSLAAGMFYGLLHEIRGYIGFFRQQYRDLAVVATGGDALRFAHALKSGIFVHPSLTLIGLHALLHYDPQRGTAAPSGPKRAGAGPSNQ
jgi:type III pantothenate kinase